MDPLLSLLLEKFAWKTMACKKSHSPSGPESGSL
ncbi:hypothetical protein L345_17218 [Ophiophagus hannah]|uniref:Uncharacterized protein n=1 Tax=Ophiophagus hannah TaxID=8665 RepID=V8N4M2_OPHHA|nr:hypothetical protein L345_17218 [Ophiophagus hannah]